MSIKSTAALLKVPDNLVLTDSSTKHFIGNIKSLERVQECRVNEIHFLDLDSAQW